MNRFIGTVRRFASMQPVQFTIKQRISNIHTQYNNRPANILRNSGIYMVCGGATFGTITGYKWMSNYGGGYDPYNIDENETKDQVKWEYIMRLTSATLCTIPGFILLKYSKRYISTPIIINRYVAARMVTFTGFIYGFETTRHIHNYIEDSGFDIDNFQQIKYTNICIGSVYWSAPGLLMIIAEKVLSHNGYGTFIMILGMSSGILIKVLDKVSIGINDARDNNDPYPLPSIDKVLAELSLREISLAAVHGVIIGMIPYAFMTSLSPYMPLVCIGYFGYNGYKRYSNASDC